MRPVLSLLAMGLITVLSFTGKAYADQSTGTFYASDSLFEEGNITFSPILRGVSPIERRMFAPGSADHAPRGSETGISPVAVSIARQVNGVDAGDQFDGYNFVKGTATLAQVGDGPPYEQPGTATVSGTTVTLTGSTTSKLTTLSAVVIDGTPRQIASITDATHFELAASHPGATAETMTVYPVYSWAEPRLVRSGIIASSPLPRLTEKELAFTIEDRDGSLSEIVSETYTGFGAAVYFRGAQGATGPVLDEAGDFTISCRWFHSLEEAATVDQYIMDNGDKRLIVDLGVPRFELDTSSGTQTVTGPSALTPEQGYQLGARFDLSTTTLGLLVDGVEVATEEGAVGTPDTSGNAWQLSKHVSASSNYATGVGGQYAWYDAYLDDTRIVEELTAPLQGDEDDLQLFLAGDINIGDGVIIESADVNADNPDDFTLAGTYPTAWKPASFLEGEAGEVVPLPIGPQRHLPGHLVDGENNVYRFATAIQDVFTLYEAGESADQTNPPIPGAPTRGSTLNTMQEMLDATPGIASLSSLVLTKGSAAFTAADTSGVAEGDRVKLDADDPSDGVGLWSMVAAVTSGTAGVLQFPYPGTGGTGNGTRERMVYDVCPQLGCVRLARGAAGEIGVDALGQGFGVAKTTASDFGARGLRLDGAGSVDFGTGNNSIFAGDHEVEIILTVTNFDVSDQVVLDAHDYDGGVQFKGESLRLQTSGTRPSLLAYSYTSNPLTELQLTSGPLQLGVTYHLRYTAEEVGGDVVVKLYRNLVLVATATDTTATLVEPTVAVVLGDANSAPLSAGNPLRAEVHEIRILQGVRDLATARDEAFQRLEKTRAGLALYVPSRLASVTGTDWFPATTILDEAEGITSTLTGTVTFTQDSTAVSASGGAFTSEVLAGDIVRHPSDSSRSRVDSVTDDDNLVLVDAYPDTGGATAAGVQIRPNDGTISGSMEWAGGPSPCNAVAQIEYILRDLPSTPYVDANFDITALYAASTAAISTFNSEFGGDPMQPGLPTIRELVAQVRTAIEAYDLYTPEGLYVLGLIVDPDDETADLSFIQEQIPRLNFGDALPLGTDFYVRHSLRRSLPELSPRVSGSVRRTLSTPYLWARALSKRNQDLGLPYLRWEALSGWHERAAASAAKGPLRALYSRNRPDLSVDLADPGQVVEPGMVLALTHEDLNGGAGNVLVAAVTAAPGAKVTTADVRGHIEEG